MSAAAPPAGDPRLHRTIWRWHFYAGLFCLPFVLWLAVTGAIYLFKPQVERWLDRPYDQLVIDGPRAAAAAQVQAALAAVPGARLNAYELPRSDTAASRVLVGRGADLVRVYVHPQTLAILRVVREDDRLMRVIFRLHGELMAGDYGSYLVELAASWAIVMLLSGLYLWWPREAAGLAGVLYPRLGAGGRRFWRDLHAVTGVWVTAFALFLLVSGLPWAKSWGGLLKTLRAYAAPAASAAPRADWTSGRSDELAQRAAANRAVAAEAPDERPAPSAEPSTATMPQAVGAAPHAGHEGHEGHGRAIAAAAAPVDLAVLDRLVATVAPLALPPPVLIAPPSAATPRWTARSETQNRPRRTTLTLDAASGAVTRRVDFGHRPLLDRIIGTGVAAHEGQLFGVANQLLGLFTALALIALSLSALVLWWSRRPAGSLGAPKPLPAVRLPGALVAAIVLLGLLLPLLGASMLAVWLIERGALRRLPRVREVLGLRPA